MTGKLRSCERSEEEEAVTKAKETKLHEPHAAATATFVPPRSKIIPSKEQVMSHMFREAIARREDPAAQSERSPSHARPIRARALQSRALLPILSEMQNVAAREPKTRKRMALVNLIAGCAPALMAIAAWLSALWMNNSWETDAVLNGKAYWDRENKFHWIEGNTSWFDIRK
jgi:hypothetical protein